MAESTADGAADAARMSNNPSVMTKTVAQPGPDPEAERYATEPRQQAKPFFDDREDFGPPEAVLDDPFDGDPNALPIETSATGKTGPILPGRGKGAAKPKKSNVQDLKKTLDDTELDPGTKETFDAVESMTPEQLARAQDASANARRPLDEYDDVQPLDDRADLSGERSRMTLDEDERQQIADKLMYDHEVDPQDIYDMSDDQLVATLEDLRTRQRLLMMMLLMFRLRKYKEGY